MPADLPLELERAGRIWWLIKLRWLAAVGVLTVTGTTVGVFQWALPVVPISLITVGIMAYNVLFSWAVQGLERAQSLVHWPRRTVDRFVHAQICLDWLALVLLIHFSGGLENPFLWFFIFHGILASILLSRRASYGHAGLAIALVTALGLLEYFHLIPHVPLRGFLPTPLYDQAGYVLGVLMVFSVSLLIVVYLTGAIMAALRVREDGVKKLQEELQQANASLQEQDRLKSEYVLLVTHNLRSPLAAISSLVAVILEGLAGETDPSTRKFLERIHKRAGALLQLVGDLLDLSRMRATSELDLETVNLIALLEAVREPVSLLAEEKQMTLTSCLPSHLPPLAGEPELLAEAVVNLLTNAIQYTPPGGQVILGAEQKGAFIHIMVTDNGIGIPAEAQPHLFEDFYRAPNAKEFRVEGTGLGLSLVQGIVARHGGQVKVESREGHGTTFTLILPTCSEERLP